MPPSEDPVPQPVGAPDTDHDLSPRERVLHRLHRPHRVIALVDGVFAIAMTLLALEIRVPEDVRSEEEFVAALGPLATAIAVFVLAFFITAQYWIRHHHVMSHVHTVDGRGVRLSVLALVGVSALPVATSLITHWSIYPEGISVAAGILIVTSLLSLRLYAHLLRPEFADIDPAERRRVLVGPLVNIAVYVLTIPVAFLLPLIGGSSAYATFLWFLMALNAPLANLVAGRAKRA